MTKMMAVHSKKDGYTCDNCGKKVGVLVSRKDSRGQDIMVCSKCEPKFKKRR